MPSKGPSDILQDALRVVRMGSAETPRVLFERVLDQTTPNRGVTDQVTQLNHQIAQARAAGLQQADTTKDNTRALGENTATKAQGSTAAAIGKTLGAFLGSGLGLSPILSGLVSLFGGGGNSEPPPLVPFARPERVELEGGISALEPGRVFKVSRGQSDVSRPVMTQAPQITVQVHAIDSRSFLDHREEIARAVRQAMLETNVLADVVREL